MMARPGRPVAVHQPTRISPNLSRRKNGTTLPSFACTTKKSSLITCGVAHARLQVVAPCERLYLDMIHQKDDCTRYNLMDVQLF